MQTLYVKFLHVDSFLCCNHLLSLKGLIWWSDALGEGLKEFGDFYYSRVRMD